MTDHHIEDLDPGQLARELNRCRGHPLVDLDQDLHGKPPVPEEEIAHLHRLARAYGAAIGVTGLTRQAAILRLLTDGLAAYALVDAKDSAYIKGFFFDPPPAADTSAAADQRADSPAPDPPRDVLKTARGGGLKAMAIALGLSVKRLAELRDAAFMRLTTFLLTYVASVSQQIPAAQVREVIAAPVPLSAPPPSPMTEVPAASLAQHSRWRLRVVGLFVTGLVLVSALVGFVAIRSYQMAARRTPTFTPGKTYVETAWKYGSPTFADPHSPGVMGPRIEPYEQVRVACKVLAPTIPSISPDGYWYLVTSPGAFANWYTPASNFLNGDPIAGPYTHPTDYAVPDCPAP